MHIERPCSVKLRKCWRLGLLSILRVSSRPLLSSLRTAHYIFVLTIADSTLSPSLTPTLCPGLMISSISWVKHGISPLLISPGVLASPCGSRCPSQNHFCQPVWVVSVHSYAVWLAGELMDRVLHGVGDFAAAYLVTL